MKISICNELFKGWSLERIMKFISNLGYDGLEIAPFTLADDVSTINKEKRREIKELSETYGVKIVGLHWLLVKPEGLHISHPNEKVRIKTIEYLKALIKFNHDIGGKILVFGSPNQRSVLKDVSREKAWNWAKEVFKEASRFAENYGSIIALEPLARHLTNFINTAEEAIKMIEEVNSPSFKLILDVYSMNDEEKSIGDIIRSSGKYLVHFHANDDNKLGPGFGNTDYIEVLKALKDINYDGYLSVEVFDFTPGPEYIAKKSIENLKKFLKQTFH